MSAEPLDRLLQRAAAAGIVSDEQAAQLLALAGDGPAASGGEAPHAFNWVNVAYGIGALLVVFAFGVFLVERWQRVSPWEVLGITVVYAAIFAVAARGLGRAGYRTAAGVAVMLVVALTPVATWALLRLADWWPDGGSGSALLYSSTWMAWQWLVLDLATVLAALLVWRRGAVVAVTWPLAVALWGVSFHLPRVLRGELYAPSLQRWTALAGGLAILGVADGIERWQRRQAADSAPAPGDFATAFWIVGVLTFGISYFEVWDHAGAAWRHLLLLVALGFVAMSLRLGRRALLAAGIVGIIGYLGWLTDTVFRDRISFPVALAGMGALTIGLVVLVQRRFPFLVSRLSGDGRGRDLPWSGALSALPALFAAVMALSAIPGLREEQAQQEFQQRLYLLRQHSGSQRPPRTRPVAAPDTLPTARPDTAR